MGENAKGAEEGLRVDLAKLSFDNVPEYERKESKKLTFADIHLDEKEVGEIDEEESVPPIKHQHTKAYEKIKYKFTSAWDRVALLFRCVCGDISDLMFGEKHDEDSIDSVILPGAQKGIAAPVCAVIAVLTIFSLIISLIAVSVSNNDDSGDDDIRFLLEDEEILEIDGKTVFGEEVGDSFEIKTREVEDILSSIARCDESPVNCISLGYTVGELNFVGNCFTSCTNFENIVFQESDEPLLVSLALSMSENVILGLQFVFDVNGNNITVTNGVEPDESDILAEFENPVLLSGITGTINADIEITSLSFIIKPL